MIDDGGRIATDFLFTASVTRLDDLLDFGQLFEAFGATINLSKYPTLLGNFRKCVKIYHFSCEISFRQLL